MGIFYEDAEGRFGIAVSGNKKDLKRTISSALKRGWERVSRADFPTYKLKIEPFKTIFAYNFNRRDVAFMKKPEGPAKQQEETETFTITVPTDGSNNEVIGNFLGVAKDLKEKFGYGWYVAFLIEGVESKYEFSLVALPDINLASFIRGKEHEGYKQVTKERLPDSLTQIPNFQLCHSLAPAIMGVIYLWLSDTN